MNLLRGKLGCAEIIVARIHEGPAHHQNGSMHTLKLKDPPQQQSQPDETQPHNNNNNFGVNIVGGQQSDPGEFPYFGS